MRLVAAAALLIPIASAIAADAPRPNIVVILVDDMGFSDLGCYGSEIATPRIDALAAGGLRFSQFYNTGRCCPTRASLLTGLYSHQAGVGHMVEDSGLPGYRGRLGDSCVTIAEALRGAGYHTSIAGKWHVGQNHGVAPWNRGFDRSLNAAAGGFYQAGSPRCDLWLDGEKLRSDWFCGESWAFLQNVPFRKYKHFNHEGGIATPLVIHWPKGIAARGEWRHQPGHLIDILSTCLDVAGGDFPRERQGKPSIPPEGMSLVPAFAGEPIARDALYWEHEGNAAVRAGDLKLVRLGAKGAWELYDLAADRTEQHDLAETRPADAARLAGMWQAWAERVHAVPRPGKKPPGAKRSKAAAAHSKTPVRPVSMRQPPAAVAEPPAPTAAASRIALERRPDRVVVTVDGEPFTEYLFDKAGLRRPVLFPLHGPHGLTLTRSWPVGPKAPGDPDDHPHHESFWFAHGDVNGHDFWTGKGGVRIEQVSLDHVGDGRIEATSRWVTADGTVICTDRRVLAFAAEGDDRIIDHTITITASHGPLVFGDTKEGTMALRVRPELNVKQAKEGPPATGHYLNDSGDRDDAAWGKPAAWVDLSGTLEGKPVGIACFDHPTNLRHPTCWHARDYGLFSANPFGLHDFTKAPKGAGRFELPAGESLTLRHRWILHTGDAGAAKIAERFAAWVDDR